MSPEKDTPPPRSRDDLDRKSSVSRPAKIDAVEQYAQRNRAYAEAGLERLRFYQKMLFFSFFTSLLAAMFAVYSAYRWNAQRNLQANGELVDSLQSQVASFQAAAAAASKKLEQAENEGKQREQQWNTERQGLQAEVKQAKGRIAAMQDAGSDLCMNWPNSKVPASCDFVFGVRKARIDL
ncbi:MAG TPA: hypothetical protein VFA81_08400, partial [Burkholderiales bacterium]|nr:hypothetical protein [Burkholderiales bacterium]